MRTKCVERDIVSYHKTTIFFNYSAKWTVSGEAFGRD